MTVATHVAAAVLAAGLAVLGTATVLNARSTAALAEKDAAFERLSKSYSDQMRTLAEASVAAETTNRAEEARRTTELQGIIDGERLQSYAARADADARAADAVGLRKQLDAFTAAARARAAAERATGRAAIASSGKAGADPLDLLADLFWRAGDRAGDLAGIADRARIAGLTCERAYDAVRGAAK